jgi:hypothetical protein
MCCANSAGISKTVEVWIITNYPVFRAALQMPLSGAASKT